MDLNVGSALHHSSPFEKGELSAQLTEGIDAADRIQKDHVGRIRKVIDLSDDIVIVLPKCHKKRTPYCLIPFGLRPAPL